MAARTLLAWLLVMLLPSVGAMDQETPPSAPDSLDCALPPCGWIQPTLDIVVDDKLPCGGGQVIYAIGPPDDCFDLLGPGETRTYTGQFIMKWEVSEEGTYPKEVGLDIVISFSGTGSNPGWLTVDVTGDDMVDGTYVIDDAALFSPDNMRQMQNAQGQDSVWFWFERDVELTFTRTGDPDAQWLQTLDDREGVLATFIKSKSSESGPRFREGFGIEEMRFNSCTDDDIARQVPPCPAPAFTGPVDQDAPGIPAALVLALLGVMALRRR